MSDVRQNLLRNRTQHLLRFKKIVGAIALGAFVSGCMSQFLKFENSEKVLKIDEFEQEQQVVEIPADDFIGPSPQLESALHKNAQKNTQLNARDRGRRAVKDAAAAPIKVSPPPTAKPDKTSKTKALETIAPASRQPEIEDTEGFTGRRPNVDPFRVGEDIAFDISYWGIDAGELTMRVLPFVTVNGRKAYRFQSTAKTVSVFESIYRVDDVAETYLDFEDMRPSSYTLKIKESKQLRNASAIHRWQDGKVKFFDKKITDESGVEEKNYEWDANPFAQNSFSAIWYLRTFQLSVGKTYRFWIAHENENLLIQCDVIRKEKLRTKLGTFETVVIKPSATKDGKPHSIGDNLFWMTADDRKLPVRIESKIKIGKIVGSLARLEKGKESPAIQTSDSR